MTIANRLYFLIGATILVLIGMASTGFYAINRVYIAANFANVNTVPSLLELSTVADAGALLRVSAYQYTVVKDSDRSKFVSNMTAAEDKLTAALQHYEKDDVADEKDRALLAEVRSSFADFNNMRKKAVELVNNGKTAEADELLLNNGAYFSKFAQAIENHRKYNEELGTKGEQDAVTMLKQANWLSLIFVVLMVVIVAGVGMQLTRKIVGALNQAVAIAETVASGDLTSTIDTSGTDEIGKLMRALNHMNDSLIQVISQVYSGTETISTASAEIAAGNLDLSVRTEAQASSLEKTASSMEELTATVRQNADNARQANQMALSASNVAVKGGSVVAEVVNTMGSINESSRKIVDIIAVIDGIAFQTNILALNAAVEAARAGEQGRGFAVVATEVRNLAQRSASAAKEIKSLIGDSVDKVDVGSKLVDQAGATMQEIVDSVKRVTDIMAEITSASEEQTAGIEQVNQAIAQMDEVTQQNAALVEEAAAAAQSMQEQTGKMTQVVSTFNIGGMRSVQSVVGHKPATHKPASHKPMISTVRSKSPASKKTASRPQPKLIKQAQANDNAGPDDDWETF